MRFFIASAFFFLYWGICFLATGTDSRNLAGLRSYPEKTQEKVRQHILAQKTGKKPLWKILLSNLILFSAVFSVIALIFRKQLALNGFGEAYIYFLLLGEGLGLFDLVVIDLLWWRNTRRIRFSFLPEKEWYSNPEKHIGSFLRGIPLFAVTALLPALVTVL